MARSFTASRSTWRRSLRSIVLTPWPSASASRRTSSAAPTQRPLIRRITPSSSVVSRSILHVMVRPALSAIRAPAHKLLKRQLNQRARRARTAEDVANVTNAANVANPVIVGRLAELEQALADPQGFDPVFERGNGNSKLRGRPRGTGHTAPAFGQRGLDNLPLALRLALDFRGVRLRRHSAALDGPFRRAH